jgi:hypothetical protein
VNVNGLLNSSPVRLPLAPRTASALQPAGAALTAPPLNSVLPTSAVEPEDLSALIEDELRELSAARAPTPRAATLPPPPLRVAPAPPRRSMRLLAPLCALAVAASALLALARR